MIDLRIVVPALAGWLAAVLLLPAPAALVPVAILAWSGAVVLAVVAVALRSTLPITLAAVLAAVALVATAAAVHGELRRPPALEQKLAEGSAGPLTLTTTQAIVGGTEHFRATLTAADGLPLSVPVRVFGAAPSTRVGIGSTLEARGELVATGPGDEVSYLLFAEGPAELVEPVPWHLAWADALRATFSEAAAVLPGDGGRLLPGLAIGDTSGVGDELDAAMKTSSLSHLTAVSGANCAIVIGLIMLAGGALGLPRGIRVTASLVVLGGFVVLVTPEPSVLRAALMAALVLASLSLGRPVRGLPVLACAVIALLVLDPWLGRSYGFTLSVLATAGLLLLSGPLTRLLNRWLPLWAAAVLAVPLAAQLACQPVLILLDASLPLYGVPANVLAAPAAPLATIVGLASCVLVGVVPPLGHALAHLAWLPAAWIAAVAHFFAGLPMARLPWPAGEGGAFLLALVTVFALVAVLAPLARRAKRMLALAAVSVVVALAAAALGERVSQQLDRPPDWQYAACDVGQGDAMVVRSEGHIAVIDTGRDPAPMADCLDTLGIHQIQLLVLTHFDADHVGGLDAVLGRVDHALAGPSGEADDERRLAELVERGATVTRVSQGTSGVLGELRWRVLWPQQRLNGIEPGNEASVAMVFEPLPGCSHGCASALFLGDLGEDAQSRMLAANPGLAAVDVVKVSHHGSADQHPRLYERASATVALIGVGENDYGHPHGSILGILRSAGSAVGRTDQHGLVLLAPGQEPGSLTMWTERPGVAADG